MHVAALILGLAAVAGVCGSIALLLWGAALCLYEAYCGLQIAALPRAEECASRCPCAEKWVSSRSRSALGEQRRCG